MAIRRNKFVNKMLNKFNKLSFLKKNLMLVVFCFLLTSIITIGYAALNQALFISGDLALRAVKDIRISNLTISETTNGGYELYNSKYSSDSISIFANLSEVGSTITYEATITNYGNVNMEIANITKTISNPSVNCTINGLQNEQVIMAGTSTVFTITLEKQNNVVTTQEDASALIEIEFQEEQTRYLAYTISGNSMQDGTPTPTTPVEIQSVGNSKNLFDLKSSVSKYTTYEELGNGINFVNTSHMYETGWELYSEEQLTLSYYVANISITNFRVRFVYSDGTYSESTSSGTTFVSSSELTSNNKTRVTATSTAGKTVIGIKFNWSSTGNVYLEQFQIEKGTTATEYQEYGKYTIPITLSGKNLFDYKQENISGTANITSSKSGDVITITGTGYWAFFNLKQEKYNFKKGTTYTFSEVIEEYTDSNNVDGIITFMCYYTDGTYDFKSTSYTTASIHSVSVTTDKEKDISHFEIRFARKNGNTSTATWKIKNIQLEEGTVATDYVPYVEPKTYNIVLDEPLRKLGDCDTCADYIDFGSKTIVRNIGYTELDGSESWSLPSTIISGYSSFRLLNFFPKVLSTTFLTNYFPTKINVAYGDYAQNLATSYTNSTQLIINIDSSLANSNSQTSTTNWLNWLSKNNLYVIYPLASSSTSAISLPEILKQPYYTNISVDTEVQPSEFTYNYVVK